MAALAAPCDLVILDEPTSGLDPLQAEVFVEAVRYAAGQGRTVLMSSHVMAEVDRLCDSVTIIKDGRTVESGRLEELRHLRASRITCVLPPEQSPAPGRHRWSRWLHLSCTGWGGLCFRVGFFVGILGVGWSFRGTKAAVGSGG